MGEEGWSNGGGEGVKEVMGVCERSGRGKEVGDGGVAEGW